MEGPKFWVKILGDKRTRSLLVHFSLQDLKLLTLFNSGIMSFKLVILTLGMRYKGIEICFLTYVLFVYGNFMCNTCLDTSCQKVIFGEDVSLDALEIILYGINTV